MAPARAGVCIRYIPRYKIATHAGRTQDENVRCLTYPDAEVVERVPVDVIELLAHAQCVVGHRSHVAVALYVARCIRQTCNRRMAFLYTLDITR